MRLGSLLLVLIPGIGGCLSVNVDSQKTGFPGPVIESHRLEPGKSTLREAFALLGPPDLILRAGQVDRAYYICWESDYVKLVVSAPLPIPSRRSVDAFILAWGSEELRLARLEFDRAGILRDLQRLDTVISRDGEYVAMDNQIVENFIEDRDRVLRVVGNGGEDEDEDGVVDRTRLRRRGIRDPEPN
jgi:hypothetical protein